MSKGLTVGAGPDINAELSKVHLNQNMGGQKMGKFNFSNMMGTAAAGADFLSGLVVPSGLGDVADTSGVEESIMDIGNYDLSQIDSFDTLKNAFSQVNAFNMPITAADLRPDRDQQYQGILGNSFKGIMSGANFGSSIGGMAGGSNAQGIGAAIGAGIGGLAYTLKGYFENKKGNEEALEEFNRLTQLEKERKAESRRMLGNQSINIMKNLNNSEWLNMAAEGGPLLTGDFTNGVRFITEGGSHEQNPFGGVLQGIATDGLPNLVEEGEVIYKDYVYSARLKVPNADKESLGLKKDKEYTFAEAADILQKESQDRPNDYISKQGLDAMMARLQGSQETLKQKRELQRAKKAISSLTPEEQVALGMYALGGHLFDGDAPGSSQLTIMPYEEFIKVHPGIYTSEEDYLRDMGEAYEGRVDSNQAPLANTLGYKQSTGAEPRTVMDAFGNIQDASSKEVLDSTGKVIGTVGPDGNSSSSIPLNLAQMLRAAPILGSLYGTKKAMLDKPNFQNIARAEQNFRNIPYVSSRPIGQKLGYTPIDINYIATQLGNQQVGARRLARESTLGNRAVGMNNLMAIESKGQEALASALMQARQSNLEQKARVAEFNRGTDQYNSAQALEAARQNQQLDLSRAGALGELSKLRDLEIARIQQNRSAQLTNLFQNVGNFGQDMLARQQVKAAVDAGVFGNLGDNKNNYLKALALAGYLACGGSLKKKGK